MNARGLRRGALLVAPWLVLHCGDSNDLIIGLLDPPGGGGQSVAGSGGTDSPSGGSSGSAAAAGGDAAGGDAAGTGGDAAGAGGDAAGAGGQPFVIDCEVGEVPPSSALLHRYDFSGTGPAVLDSIAGANGVIIQPDETVDDGLATFDGETGGVVEGSPLRTEESFVNLPNGLISSLTDATIVAWTTWNGGSAYQRIFDFGMSNAGEGARGGGQDFFVLFHKPSTTDASNFGFLELEIDPAGGGVAHVETPQNLPNDVEHQYAVVVHAGNRMDLFIDGEIVVVLETPALLADIDDRNSWLGRSNFQSDAAYNGSFNEFRIYNVALSPCVVKSLYDAGPDMLP